MFDCEEVEATPRLTCSPSRTAEDIDINGKKAHTSTTDLNIKSYKEE